ncbi:Apoptosis facilitator Bcl-2-like 14, partial [Buceros rhinoceros silvestris]
MEEIPLENDERDSIEYHILMAYAQRRLSVSKYRKLLKNEVNVRKSSSLIRRKVKTGHQRGKDGPDGPSQRRVLEVSVLQQPSKEQPNTKYLPGCHPHFLCGLEKQGKPFVAELRGGGVAHSSIPEAQSDIRLQGPLQHKTNVTVKLEEQGPSLLHEQDRSGPAGGSESEEHDKEMIIQTIVSLLRQSGDQLEKKIQKDRVFFQHFRDMLSYNFFERITDLFLEGVSAGSTTEPRGQVQCAKLAFTMEVVTRLTAVDNHPMNLVLGFGLKYLREHFKPWIQDQGGW